MEIIRTRRKSREVSMVPLINVIFILVIFFLLAGSFEKIDVLPVDVPQAKSGKMIEEGHIIIVIGKHDEILVDDALIPLEDLQAKIKQLLAFNPDRVITIKADAASPARGLLGVMTQVRLGGGRNLSIATQSAE